MTVVVTVEGANDDTPFLTVSHTCVECGALLNQTKMDCRCVSVGEAASLGEDAARTVVEHKCPNTGDGNASDEGRSDSTTQ